MRLTLNDIKKSENNFILTHIDRSNKYINNSRQYLRQAIDKQNIKDIWICNPYLDGVKWRNCSPIKAFITDCDYEYGYVYEYVLEELNKAIEQGQGSNKDYYEKFRKGIFAHLQSSFYDGNYYCNIDMIDLEYALGDDFVPTNYFHPYHTGYAKKDQLLSARRCLKEYIAVFDNEKEAKQYIKEIRTTSSSALNCLEEELKNINSELERLQSRKEVVLKEIDEYNKKYKK